MIGVLKRITRPMMGCNAFHSAMATLAGIYLYCILENGQNGGVKSTMAFEQSYASAA
jgi:hypothetical protein